VTQLLAAFLLLLPAYLPPDPPPPLPDPVERAELLKGHLESAALLMREPPMLSGQNDYDVLHYELDLFVDPAAERIEGRCGVTFQTSPGSGALDLLELNLIDFGLVVTGVRYDGVEVPLNEVFHGGHQLRVPLVPPLLEGAGSALVEIDYEGTPGEGLNFRDHDGVDVIYSYSQPFDARTWWPCKDRPEDKATATLHVEAPEDMWVVGNGMELGRVAGRPGYQITTWQEAYPIATYLVSFAATNYQTWQETYEASDGTPMLIQQWVYPEHFADAQEDLSVTVPMIEFFSDAFYEYPFLEEKYGHAVTETWGAMEHQTATTYGAVRINGNHRYDYLVAHELSHQWWGNDVTPSSYASVWINEGFATWCEALWWEHLYGRQEYLAYMQNLDSLQVLGTEFDDTVYEPERLFGTTVYDKGAWILHMLRWLLAQPTLDAEPQPLLEVLRAHGQAHAYANASSEDFIATASEYAGEDLHWFFDPWLHRTDRPDYLLSWADMPQPGGDHVLHLRVDQRQAGDPYRLAVLLRVQTAGGPVEQVVWNDGRRTDYRITLSDEATDLSWDEDGWLLKLVEVQPVGNGDLDGDLTPDVFDCAADDSGVWSEPVGNTLLLVAKSVEGRAELWFTNPDPVGQRAYSTDAAVGGLAALRSSGTFDDASCLIAGHPDPSVVDTSPDSPEAKYYQAWPWNGCGPTDTSGLPLSPCR
jgi:aminopeptidase N